MSGVDALPIGSLALLALSDAHRSFSMGHYDEAIAGVNACPALCALAAPLPSRQASLDRDLDDHSGAATAPSAVAAALDGLELQRRTRKDTSTRAVAWGLARMLRGFSALLTSQSNDLTFKRRHAVTVLHSGARPAQALSRHSSRSPAPTVSTATAASNSGSPPRTPWTNVADDAALSPNPSPDRSGEQGDSYPLPSNTSSSSSFAISDAKGLTIAYPSFVVGRLLAAEVHLDRGEYEAALESVHHARAFHEANLSLGIRADGALHLLMGLLTVDAACPAQLEYCNDEERILGHYLASVWQCVVSLRRGAMIQRAQPTEEDPFCVAQYIAFLEATVRRCAAVARHSFLVGAPQRPECPHCHVVHNCIPRQWLCEGCGPHDTSTSVSGPRPLTDAARNSRVSAFFKAATSAKSLSSSSASTPNLVWSPTQRHCGKCATKISVGARHHCRSCGANVCGPCSEQRRLVPALGFDTAAVRVCRNCADILDAKSCDASPSPQRRRGGQNSTRQ